MLFLKWRLICRSPSYTIDHTFQRVVKSSETGLFSFTANISSSEEKEVCNMNVQFTAEDLLLL
jgi:hypothetical protein